MSPEIRRLRTWSPCRDPCSKQKMQTIRFTAATCTTEFFLYNWTWSSPHDICLIHSMSTVTWPLLIFCVWPWGLEWTAVIISGVETWQWGAGGPWPLPPLASGAGGQEKMPIKCRPTQWNTHDYLSPLPHVLVSRPCPLLLPMSSSNTLSPCP